MTGEGRLARAADADALIARRERVARRLQKGDGDIFRTT